MIHLVFFFKQKTAYELLAGLEFRRVLFRSGRSGSRKRESRRPRRGPRSPASRRRTWSGSRRDRSEERRVGKECRSRSAGDAYITKKDSIFNVPINQRRPKDLVRAQPCPRTA